MCIGGLGARGRWISGAKGRGLCEWEILEMIGAFETGRQLARQGLGSRKKELEVGRGRPKRRALWECGRSVGEE